MVESAPGHRGSEKALVFRCLAGEPEGWKRFIAEYTPSLAYAIHGTLRRFNAVQDPALVEDLVQETFVSLLRDQGAVLRQFQWDCSLNHYLVSIAVHRAVDWLRQSRPGLSLDAETSPGALWKDLLEEGRPGPADRAESAESLARLRKAIDQLSLQERLILRLYYWRSLTPAAIGRILQLQPGSVWVYIWRARQRLREILKESPPLFLL